MEGLRAPQRGLKLSLWVRTCCRKWWVQWQSNMGYRVIRVPIIVSHVNNYAVASESQQRSMCNILCGESASEWDLVPQTHVRNDFESPSAPIHSENVSLSQSSMINSKSTEFVTRGIFTSSNIYCGNFNIIVNPFGPVSPILVTNAMLSWRETICSRHLITHFCVICIVKYCCIGSHKI